MAKQIFTVRKEIRPDETNVIMRLKDEYYKNPSPAKRLLLEMGIKRLAKKGIKIKLPPLIRTCRAILGNKKNDSPIQQLTTSNSPLKEEK